MKSLIDGGRWLVAALFLLASGLGAAADGSLGIGIAPHTSARVILEQYQPLRVFLERQLGLPVEILTAPDFTEYARRAVAQQYDIAITTGHQARLLQADGGYLPLVTYQADFKAVVVAARDSRIRSAADLKATTVLGLSPSSLVTLWGIHWLQDQRVTGIALRHVSAADSVAQLILAGDASAGFMSTANFSKLPADVQARLRILAESEPMAGRVYMLNGRQKARHEAIDAALRAFARTPEGAQYFDVNKLGGYRNLRPGELAAMERYADEVRQELAKPHK